MALPRYNPAPRPQHSVPWCCSWHSGLEIYWKSRAGSGRVAHAGTTPRPMHLAARRSNRRHPPLLTGSRIKSSVMTRIGNFKRIFMPVPRYCQAGIRQTEMFQRQRLAPAPKAASAAPAHATHPRALGRSAPPPGAWRLAWGVGRGGDGRAAGGALLGAGAALPARVSDAVGVRGGGARDQDGALALRRRGVTAGDAAGAMRGAGGARGGGLGA